MREESIFALLVTTALAEVCLDQSTDCAQLANLCDDATIQSLIRAKCPETCGVCACRDDPSVECDKLAYLCNDRSFQNYTAEHCPKTCGYCRECTDNEDRCVNEAMLCKEASVKDVMAKRCPKTCGYCSYLECEDLEIECVQLYHHCNDSDMQSYMASNCAKTCNYCYDWQRCSATGYWYKVLNIYGPWSFLESICAGVGGHLASIHSDAETKFILEMLSTVARRSSPWIGLHSDNGSDVWSDGSPVIFTNYYSSPSNNSCYTMLESTNSNEGQWAYKSCDYNYIGVCKKPSHHA